MFFWKSGDGCVGVLFARVLSLNTSIIIREQSGFSHSERETNDFFSHYSLLVMF